MFKWVDLLQPHAWIQINLSKEHARQVSSPLRRGNAMHQRPAADDGKKSLDRNIHSQEESKGAAKCYSSWPWHMGWEYGLRQEEDEASVLFSIAKHTKTPLGRTAIWSQPYCSFARSPEVWHGTKSQSHSFCPNWKESFWYPRQRRFGGRTPFIELLHTWSKINYPHPNIHQSSMHTRAYHSSSWVSCKNASLTQCHIPQLFPTPSADPSPRWCHRPSFSQLARKKPQ